MVEHPREASYAPDRFIPRLNTPSLANLALLIPAWQPGPELVELVDALAPAGFGRIVVVDDGSAAACVPLFQALASRPGVHLVRHPRNLGKGRALKTGMAFVLQQTPPFDGMVTADADGQHTPADIVRIGLELLTGSGRPVLGSRELAKAAPWRSSLGGRFLRTVFARQVGDRIRDTQSGLRALPTVLLPSLIALPGERYEFETVMLAHLCRTGCKPTEVPMQTVYFRGNRSSHFRPVRDSLRILRALLAFSARR